MLAPRATRTSRPGPPVYHKTGVPGKSGERHLPSWRPLQPRVFTKTNGCCKCEGSRTVEIPGYRVATDSSNIKPQLVIPTPFPSFLLATSNLFRPSCLGFRASPATYQSTYVDNYFDADGRPIGSADFGANASLAGTDASALPAQSSTGPLVTSETYGSAGFENTTTDAAGIVTTYTNDAMGRHIIVVETKPGSTDGATVNTAYTYNGLNDVTQTTGKNVVPGSSNPQYQVTKYIYGTSTYQGSGPTNDNLIQIELPGYSSTANNQANAPYQESFVYDNQGDTIGKIDQNGVLHKFTLDAMGRTVEEDVSYKVVSPNPTPPVDFTVSARTYTYNVLGQLAFASTYA